MFDLTGKVAAVIGGSRGIGRAAAEALARSGARVVLSYAHSSDAARQVVAEIEQSGGAAEAIHLDIANSEACEDVLRGVARRLGRLDILVVSAGVSSDALLLELTDSELDRVLAVNLKGAVYCARSAMRTMLRARTGRVILISSAAAETGLAGQSAYASSKAALLGLAKALAREYAERGITVNAIAPGYVETDMTSALSDVQRRSMLTGIPMRRPGTPAEVGAAAVYLASDEAAYVTGHTLRVNGGIYM
jgi:3-oxoacyl-[acyl-carrier protein] reductase